MHRFLIGFLALLAAGTAQAQGWDAAYAPYPVTEDHVAQPILAGTWEEAEAAFELLEFDLALLQDGPTDEHPAAVAAMMATVGPRFGRIEMGLRAAATVRQADGEAPGWCVEELLLALAVRKATAAAVDLTVAVPDRAAEPWDEAAYQAALAELQEALGDYQEVAAAAAPRRARGWVGECAMPYGRVTIDGEAIEIR
ncbi:MAG TPA: hypothetical protein VD962_04910 [Rubricoccaceae bacterium]|nr:hypothetical protein [Rubricoccaceae bacterium]